MSETWREESRRANRRLGLILGATLLGGVAIVVGLTAVYPLYHVYSQRMQGRAELQRAESSRQIRIVEAHAALESAKLTAQAEVERAKGVAQANQIIAGSLGGPEGYLRWRYIEMLELSGKAGRDVIYVPTEAALPILEAGKRP